MRDPTSVGGGTDRDAFFETYGIRILRAIRQIIRAVDVHSRRLRAEHSVTTPQLICLYSLAHGEPVTLSQLARNVNLGVSTVNGIVDRLETRDQVCRRRCTVDRRRVYVECTEAGRRLIADAPSLLQDRLAEALQELPELEQASIALSLERVVELMEAKDLDASPNLLPSGHLNESPSNSPGSVSS